MVWSDMLWCYLYSFVGEEVSYCLLKCLILLGNEFLLDVFGEWSNIGFKFGDFMNIVVVLVSVGDGVGYFIFCVVIIKWLEKWYV